MEISFTLWSLKGVLEKVPLEMPQDESIDINFSDVAVPYYIKQFFKVAIVYEDSLPYEACCTIYSPNHIVTVVIIMKRQYEEYFKMWKKGEVESNILDFCCLRRELYCHEMCHLTAIVRAFPSNRSSIAREDFKKKIQEKFKKSVDSAEKLKAVPLVSVEKTGASPSAFDKDHFRYDDDSLNYFGLYQELMLDYDKMLECVKKLCARINGETITFEDVARETFVSRDFFQTFPEKLTEFRKLFAEEMQRDRVE
jgi:hypothetical protein